MRGISAEADVPIVNAEIANQLDRIADLLDIKGENPFRIRAYRRAAQIVGELPRSVADMVEAGEDLDALPGIGRDLADKSTALAGGEHVPMLDQLMAEVPPGVTELLALPGLGPKRVRVLHEKLGIASIDALRAAAIAGKLHEIAGFGPHLEAKLLHAITARTGAPQRLSIAVAEQIVVPLTQYLRQTPGVRRIEVGGSYRRRRETVGDLDIVIAAAPSEPVMCKSIDFI